MNISIAVADLDREYVKRLSEVLQQYNELTIHAYTNEQKLREGLEKGGIDIVLFDPDILEHALSFTGIKLSVCLYSDEARNSGLYAEFVKIPKYQRISNIYKGILQEYAKKAGYSADFDYSQATSVIAVYSPIGGSGKTTVALALASQMAGRGKRALFLSAEPLSSTQIVNPGKENGIVALIEASGNENVNFELTIKGLLKPGLNGMFYLEGFERLADYDAISGEEITDVLKRIRRCGVCDVVIVDMGSNLDTVGRAIAREADRIVIVEKPGELPAEKMRLFAQQAFANEYRSKMIVVHNFADNHSKYSIQTELPLAGTIHNYENLLLKNIIRAINMNGELQTDKIIRK